MNPAALWYFESISLFRHLCLEKGGAAMTGHEVRNFHKNEFVYYPGQSAEEIYFVMRGRVKVFERLPTGGETIKSMLTRGEIFGELALAGEKERTNSAVAVEHQTAVACIPLVALNDMMIRDKAFSFSVLKLLGFRLNRLERRIEQLVCKDVRTRVIEFLKDAAEWKGKKVGSETLIFTPLTHGEMAKLMGLSRQTVTATLNTLKSENQIYFDRKRILIRNINALC